MDLALPTASSSYNPSDAHFVRQELRHSQQGQPKCNKSELVEQPVEIKEYRCVDETTYCIDGIKYWLWVATSDRVCVLLLAPTRSSAELQKLLGQNFEGILSSDCFSAYNPQSAAVKQNSSVART